MSIDPSNMEQAKEWSKRKLLNPGNDTDGVRVAQVITALPDTIVDGDKLREALDWLDSKPSGDDYDGEFYDRLRALLPDPAPTAEIRLGSRAIHPDHGEVLIASSRPDGDGAVEILFPGLQAGDGTARVWVPADHLSPVPSATDTKTTTEQELNPEISPEPQNGEAWEVTVDDEKFNAIVSGAGYLYVDTVRTWTPAHSVTPLRRLVPEQQPRTLVTIEDYRDAPSDTVVRESGENIAVEKIGRNAWNDIDGARFTDYTMAGTSRTVLWEPDA